MKILIVEDDDNIRSIIKKALIGENYEVEDCDDGADAVEYAVNYSFDVILLDRLLPSMNGIEVLKKLHEYKIHVPVLMVTAMNQINDRIEGLDAGADDYLVKPFATQELLARVRALIRRSNANQEETNLNYADVTVHSNDLSLCYQDHSVSISSKECNMLEYFFLHPDTTLNRERIITRIWGSDADITEGNLDNYILFLRRRLRSIKAPIQIKTVYGRGYRLERSNNAK